MLEGGAGKDALDGGGGSDTASYAQATAGVTADLSKPANNTGDAGGDTYKGIENLLGSAFNDKLTGNNGANTLTGGPETTVSSTSYACAAYPSSPRLADICGPVAHI